MKNQQKQYHSYQRMAAAVLSLIILLSILITGCNGKSSPDGQTESGAETSAVSQTEPSQSTVVSEKDDYYEAVNGELIDSWEIEPDESMKNWFSILQDRVNERIAEIIRETSEKDDLLKGSDESNVRALYLTGMDEDSRNAGGFGETVSAFLTQVDEAGSVEELTRICMEFCRNYGLYSIFGMSVGADYEDSSVKTLSVDAGDTGLSKEIWFSEDETNQAAVSAFEELLRKLGEIEGYSQDEARKAAEDTVNLMRSLAEKSLSQSELYDPEKTYNVYTVSQLEELFSGNISSEMVAEIFGVGLEEPVIVTEIEKTKLLGTFLTEENLPVLKEYVKLCAHKDLGSYIDMESNQAVLEYNMTVSGTEESSPFEERLMDQIQGLLGFECGKMYCQQYYPEETTADVTRMIDQVKETFRRRIDGLEWMSEATKEEAKNKLDKLNVRVGHPDTWPQDRYELVLDAPEDGGIYIENYLKAAKASVDYDFATKDEPTDRTLWPDTPQTVNAYYDSQTNSITILAGILQDPFYNPEASPEENLGGIGTVIGHEITHAFDTSGSQFDENGNLRDWWTAEDKERFQELAGNVISYYDGMEVNGRTVNGQQTVTENIADLGGVSCVTEIAGSEGYDLKKVYESYANIWASKEREEYSAMLIAIDTHSPAKIRINAVLSAQPEFRSLYGIEEGDGMYQESMPNIW